MTTDDIEWLIVQLLAEDRAMDAHDLWKELRDLGGEMPVDSLLAVEVVVRVEEQLGVELPTTAETAKALRSVRSFAQAVWNALPKSDAGTMASA